MKNDKEDNEKSIFDSAREHINNNPRKWINHAMRNEYTDISHILAQLDITLEKYSLRGRLNYYRQAHGLDFETTSDQGKTNRRKLKSALWKRIERLEEKLEVESNKQLQRSKDIKKRTLQDIIDKEILEKLARFLISEKLMGEEYSVYPVEPNKRTFSIICHILRVKKLINNGPKAKDTQTIARYFDLKIGSSTAGQSYTGDRLEQLYSKKIENFFIPKEE